MNQLNPVTLGVLVILSGWFIYHFLEPFLLIRRRAFLKEIYTSHSLARRLFWRGEVLRSILGIKALGLGALAIALLAGTTPHERVALAAGLPLLAIASWLSWCLLKSQIAPEYRFCTALRFGYWIAFGAALVGITWWAIVFFEVPATTHFSLAQVAQQSFDRAAAEAAWKPFGLLLGINAALNDSSWHLLQVIETDRVWGNVGYLAVCALVLGWVALKLAVIWLVPLGIAAAIYRQKENGWRMLGDGDLSRGFAISLGVIFVLYLAATQISIPLTPNGNDAWSRTGIPEAIPPTCDMEIGELVDALERELPVWQSEQRRDFEYRVRQLVSSELDTAFAQAEISIETFLDWNYSLKGQYQQLLYMGASVAGSGNLSDFIADKIDEHVHASFSEALDVMSEVFREELSAEILGLWRTYESVIQQRIGDNPCISAQPPIFVLIDYVDKSMVGAGSGAAILAARVSTSTGARIVGRQGLSRFLALLGPKLAARAPFIAGAGGVGKLCGPAAIVCAPVLAVTAWIVTDALINMGDEALNRNDVRQEMLAALREDREALEAALVNEYLALAATVFSDIERYQGERFNPYRDRR